MVIKRRKGKDVARVIVEIELGLWDMIHVQSLTSKHTFREILERCIRSGIHIVSQEIVYEQTKEHELSKKYKKEGNE